MQEYDVEKHKGHLIYAAATPAANNKRWHAEGIVFSTNFPEPVEKIHRMKKQVGLRHRETSKRPRDSALQDLDRQAERKEKCLTDAAERSPPSRDHSASNG